MNATMNCENTSECRTEQTRRGRVYRPNVDIFEKESELIVQAEMPGANASDIDVHFEKGTLTIRAGVPNRYGDRPSMLAREFGIGDYVRSFQVSQDIDAAAITAEYKHGVLTLNLPKTSAAKPRKIAVRA